MIHITKLHISFLIVICTFEFIDASCLSYGHSCWGAHGKRSYMPQREQNQETKTGESSDRWSIFKIVPERNDIYRLKGVYPGNTQFTENAINQLNFPSFEQQLSSAEDGNSIARDISSSHEGIPHELDSFQTKQAALRRQFPLVLRNKPNYDQ